MTGKSIVPRAIIRGTVLRRFSVCFENKHTVVENVSWSKHTEFFKGYFIFKIPAQFTSMIKIHVIVYKRFQALFSMCCLVLPEVCHTLGLRRGFNAMNEHEYRC